jgi:hypothetical protein
MAHGRMQCTSLTVVAGLLPTAAAAPIPAFPEPLRAAAGLHLRRQETQAPASAANDSMGLRATARTTSQRQHAPTMWHLPQIAATVRRKLQNSPVNLHSSLNCQALAPYRAMPKGKPPACQHRQVAWPGGQATDPMQCLGWEMARGQQSPEVRGGAMGSASRKSMSPSSLDMAGIELEAL